MQPERYLHTRTALCLTSVEMTFLTKDDVQVGAERAAAAVAAAAALTAPALLLFSRGVTAFAQSVAVDYPFLMERINALAAKRLERDGEKMSKILDETAKSLGVDPNVQSAAAACCSRLQPAAASCSRLQHAAGGCLKAAPG